MKFCSKCKTEKDITLFDTDKRKKDGLRTPCKECRKMDDAKWRKENPEKYKDQSKRSRIKHKDKIKAYQKEYSINGNRAIVAKRCVEKLSQFYVRARLREIGFTKEQIEQTPELLEVIKIIIKTKRLCKSKNQ